MIEALTPAAEKKILYYGASDYATEYNITPDKCRSLNEVTGEYNMLNINWFKKDILPVLRPYLIQHGNWLDIGCAYGAFAPEMEKEVEQLYCVDHAAKRIKFAKNKHPGKNINYIHCGGQDLYRHFKPNSIDVITMLSVFRHMPLNIKKRTLKHALRVLKVNHPILLIDIHILTTDNVIARYVPRESYEVSFGWIRKVIDNLKNKAEVSLGNIKVSKTSNFGESLFIIMKTR